MTRSFEGTLNSTTMVIFALLGMVVCFFLFYPADSLGLWARIIGVGFAVSVPPAALSLVTDVVLHRRVNWVRPQLIAAFCCLGSVVGYAGVSWQTERPLQSAITSLKSGIGCMEVHLKGRDPFMACYQSLGAPSFTYRMPHPKPLPPNVVVALRAAEDVRQPEGMIASDVPGTVHALKSGGAIGGSNICQQVSRALLSVPRQGTIMVRLIGKARVFIGCSTLDGFMSRSEQMGLYGEIVPMGAVGAVELQGLGAGAHVLFAKDLETLSLGEAVTLAALINIPGVGFPVAKPGDTADSVESRRARLEKHFNNIVINGLNHRLFTERQAEQMRKTFGDTFVEASQLAFVIPPSIRCVRAEVLRHVPDANRRFLRVDSDYDPILQDIVVAGAKTGIVEVSKLLPAVDRQGVKADIAVVNASGHEVAEVNLARSYSDVGSIHKLLLYPFAVATRCLANMQEPILKEPADVALATSDPRAAEFLLTTCVRPHEYASFVGAAAGWRVSNPALSSPTGFSSMAMGSGVSATPLQVASTIRIYATTDPGVLVQPSFCSAIVDAATGAILFAPDSRRIFSPEIAAEITSALKLTAKIGTTRAVLGSVSAQHADLISKTGTPHFMKGGRIRGAGGAWLATGADGLFFGIRVTTTNHEEIPLDGAVGAGIVGKAIYHKLFDDPHSERKAQ